jgi:Tol biopolymer transport system component
MTSSVPEADVKPTRGPFRELHDGQRSQVRIAAIDGASDEIVLEVPYLLEAPNWTPDGTALILNGHGRMFRLDLGRGTELVEIPLGQVCDANNDHVLSPDGQTIYVSAGGHIFAVPIAGGEPIRLSPEGSVLFFLHGVSPDGAYLACTTIDPASEEHRWGIQLLPAEGGDAVPLQLGHEPMDGPEWTPDGAWIWFNAELGATVPGHAQLFRMKPDGSGCQQMSNSARVDWFPHPDPAGTTVVYLSYPAGTEGHPSDRAVELRAMPAAGGPSRTLARFWGGQGTINVNSWSPDSQHFAYVAYQLAEPQVQAPS